MSRTVDRYSYCRGLFMASQLCERPVMPYDSDQVERAAPIHARSIRLLIEAHFIDDEEGLREVMREGPPAAWVSAKKEIDGGWEK